MSSQPENIGKQTWQQQLHQWRVEHVSDRMFLLVLAFFVGLFAAVAAFVLHGMINQIVALLTGQFRATGYNWLYLVYIDTIDGVHGCISCFHPYKLPIVIKVVSKKLTTIECCVSKSTLSR